MKATCPNNNCNKGWTGWLGWPTVKSASKGPQRHNRMPIHPIYEPTSAQLQGKLKIDFFLSLKTIINIVLPLGVPEMSRMQIQKCIFIAEVPLDIIKWWSKCTIPDNAWLKVMVLRTRNMKTIYLVHLNERMVLYIYFFWWAAGFLSLQLLLSFFLSLCSWLCLLLRVFGSLCRLTNPLGV